MRIRLASAFVAFVSFLALTAALDHPELRRLDESLVARAGELRSPDLNDLAIHLGSLGYPAPLALQSLVAVVLLAAARERRIMMQVLVVMITSPLLNLPLKAWIDRARPALPDLAGGALGGAYPSGHLIALTALYLTLALAFSPRIPDRGGRLAVHVLVILVLLIVGIIRVYSGDHYPTDVAGGALLGGAWALAIDAGFLAWSRSRTSRMSAR